MSNVQFSLPDCEGILPGVVHDLWMLPSSQQHHRLSLLGLVAVFQQPDLLFVYYRVWSGGPLSETEVRLCPMPLT